MSLTITLGLSKLQVFVMRDFYNICFEYFQSSIVIDISTRMHLKYRLECAGTFMAHDKGSSLGKIG